MKKKKRKDIAKLKSKIRKQQIDKADTAAVLTEEDAETEEIAGLSKEASNRLAQKVFEMSGIEAEPIRSNAFEKMSDILLDYAEPFLDTIDVNNKAEYEKVIMMAIMFWNCSILDESRENRKIVRDVLKPFMTDAESRNVVSYMFKRKRMMYPDNKRMMLNYELTKAPGGFHLSVASTINEEIKSHYYNNSAET